MSNPASEQPAPAVLVVDDSATNRSALADAVRHHGLTALEAGGAQQALAALGEHDVGVVLADFRMPDHDGVWLLAEVRRRHPLVQGVLVTGHADTEILARAINQAGVRRFVAKPWTLQEVGATVSDALDQHAALRDKATLAEQLRARNRDLQAVNLELEAANRDLMLLNRELEAKAEDRARRLLDVEMSAAVGRLANGVAHELNNPLHGILSFAQLARRLAPGDERLPEYLETIEHSALRCKTIIEALQMLARRRAPGPCAAVDCNHLIELALTLYAPFVRRKGIRLERALAPNLPQVLGRASDLERVMIVLIENAVDAVPQSGALRVGSAVDDDGAALVVTVEDSGPGVPAELRDRIFEPFFTTKPEGQGSGLGLAIARGTVEEHGGQISVGPAALGGARFCVRLPLSASAGAR